MSRFQSEELACRSGASGQSRETCMQEARAALQAAQRGNLTDATPDYQANRVARCTALEGIDRDACLARMTGAGTSEGSIAGGGILRESTVRYVVDPASGKPVALPSPPATR